MGRVARWCKGLVLGSCLFVGCSSSHQGDPYQACRVAGDMSQSALAEAQRDAPECSRADDCVVLSLAVECPNLVQLRDCGVAVHREVARRYAEKRVNEAICEAVEGLEFGCSSGPICVATGALECNAGRCERPQR